MPGEDLRVLCEVRRVPRRVRARDAAARNIVSALTIVGNAATEICPSGGADSFGFDRRGFTLVFAGGKVFS